MSPAAAGMRETTRVQPFPRRALWAAAAMIGLALLAAGLGRLTGFGLVELPEVDATNSHLLRFVDGPDGSVVVRAVEGDRVIAVLGAGEGGFVRGVLRALARERRASDIGTEPPFSLDRHVDGRLTLADPTTGRRIDLGAFGPTNTAAFQSLLAAAEAPR